MAITTNCSALAKMSVRELANMPRSFYDRAFEKIISIS